MVTVIFNLFQLLFSRVDSREFTVTKCNRNRENLGQFMVCYAPVFIRLCFTENKIFLRTK